MEITVEQIKALDKKETTVRELFPEVFEVKPKAMTWVFVNRNWKSDKEALVFYNGSEEKTYGFSHGGNFCNSYGSTFDTFKNKKYTYRQATEQEVFEALKNEAVKKYTGKYFISLFFADICEFKSNEITLVSGSLCVGNMKIFENGIWAEIIETITKEEAEKLLNKKIVC